MLILQRIVSPCNPSEPLTGTHYFTTKIINIKKFHITTFLPPSLARVLFRGTLPLIMAQQKRGFKFALCKIESLLKVVKAIIPIGYPNCMEDVVMGHDDNSERRGARGNTPCSTLPPPRPTLPPQNSESRTTFVQAHKINFGTEHKHKFYVYARKHRFMFTCINTKFILGSLH
jgi:hypothetical protein